jgi:hypothetical protein
MVIDQNKKLNISNNSFQFVFFISSIFKRSGKEGKKKKGKGSATEQDLRRAQAIEFKQIIQEMVDDLQEADSQKSKPGARSDEPISGRPKDIVDYESVLQSRRKEIMKKIHKDRKVKKKKKKKKKVTTTQQASFDSTDPLQDDTKIYSGEYQTTDKDYNEIDLTEKEIKIRQPYKLKPTEEGVVEFDPDKYFHQRDAPVLIREPKIMKYDEPEEITKSKRGKPKKHKGKKKKSKKGTPKELPMDQDKGLGSEIEYFEELSVLDELLGVMEKVKKSDQKANLDSMISDMERIITDYKATEDKVEKTQKKYAEYFDVIEELEELEEVDELDELDTLDELEELDELDTLEELEEVEDSIPSPVKQKKKGMKAANKKTSKKKKKDKSKTKKKQKERPEGRTKTSKKSGKKKKKKPGKKVSAVDELPELEEVE